MANTKPPVSTSVDHERWAQERERQLREAIDGEPATVKITDPILDSRWAVIFGGTLWVVLVGMFIWMSTKMDNMSNKTDATYQKMSDLAVSMAQQRADQSVIKAQFSVLEQKVDRIEVRVDKLEERR